jgi:arylsulfatase A-like enzyme
MTGTVRNVFLLSADSLRADVLPARTAELAETVGGVNFTTAYATANATAHSMPALTAGIYRDSIEERFGEHVVTLAERLSESEFACSLWADNKIVGPERGYDRGFPEAESRNGDGGLGQVGREYFTELGSERFFEWAQWLYFNLVKPVEERVTSSSGYYMSAGEHNAAVLEHLESGAGDQFHWVHYMDTHHPFEPPKEYMASRELHTPRNRHQLSGLSSKAIISNKGKGVTDEDIEDIRQAYLASSEYWYDAVSEFVEELMARGHYDPDRDVMVITSDHGETFDVEKHEMLGHTPTPAFWEELVRVPLIVNVPDWPRTTVDGQVSLIDVVPTVAWHATGTTLESTEGRAVESPEEMVRECVYFGAKGPELLHRGVKRDDGWKLFSDRIRTSDVNEFTTDEADHNETRVILSRVVDGTDEVEFVRPLGSSDRPSGRPGRVWEELMDDLERNRGPLTSSHEEELSEEVREQLKELGYVDDI